MSYVQRSWQGRLGPSTLGVNGQAASQSWQPGVSPEASCCEFAWSTRNTGRCIMAGHSPGYHLYKHLPKTCRGRSIWQQPRRASERGPPWSQGFGSQVRVLHVGLKGRISDSSSHPAHPLPCLTTSVFQGSFPESFANWSLLRICQQAT